MRRILAILLALICVALPLQASAGTVMAGKHCPHMEAMKASMATHSSSHHRCCNDAATVAKTGQLCKTGHDCSPPLNYLLSPIVLTLEFTTDARQSPAIPARIPISSPSAVWRPPALG